jgi:EAL domain-containing protein (putative c-di-GMP-specific phosphodiesterase class I)/GGDEF domain-containing protein
MDYRVTIDETQRNDFYEILEKQLIYPVYQPIVSLENGVILGYEALSRINKIDTNLNVSSMFHLAEELGKVWELEAVCRKLSLKHASNKPNDVKLFLNVDPNVIHDDKFKAGLTYTYLERYNLKPEDIIFEITERTNIEDAKTFQATIQHYKSQQFKIAIDDFGDGYAGVNRVCAVLPDYIKLDMAIVRDIDKDTIKQTLVENLVHLCKEIHINMIAEGIETEAELKELIRLDVPYGQGYYLQTPNPEMKDITEECKKKISEFRLKSNKYSYKPSIFGNVGTICKAKNTTTLGTPAHTLYEHVTHNSTVTEICVLDENSQVKGICTRVALLEHFGGRYGYNLYSKRTAKDVMNPNFMMVDANTSIEIVSQMALSRPMEHLYDAVVVTQSEKYMGVVTVKDLLETAITIQVSRAVDANPLTGLPGNKIIEKCIHERIFNNNPYTIIYLDLDNFKAYNDAYGFNNGDTMIQTVVYSMEQCCIENEFMGHIGGDDFVIICDYWDARELCQNVIDTFQSLIRGLYSDRDWENGFIISKNRNGITEKFPIVSLSVAGLTNREKQYKNLDFFSQEIALVKKMCKQVEGNFISIM